MMEKDDNEEERLKIARSLFGVIPADITLEEAREERLNKILGLRGRLNEYARTDDMEKDEGAWERAVVEKYGKK